MADTTIVSREDVKKHNTQEDCWIIINGKVYNVTKYLSEHPGGPEILLDQAGNDATDDFEDTGHTPEARETLKKFYVGDADGPAPSKARATASAGGKSEGPSMLVVILVMLLLCAGAYFLTQGGAVEDVKSEL